MRSRWARSAKVSNSRDVTRSRSGERCAFKIIPRIGEGGVSVIIVFHTSLISAGTVEIRATDEFILCRRIPKGFL